MLTRYGAKWLLALRRVDLGQPDLNLLVCARLAAPGRNGVAVSNANDEAEQEAYQEVLPGVIN